MGLSLCPHSWYRELSLPSHSTVCAPRPLRMTWGCCVQFWAPLLREDIEVLERVQSRATERGEASGAQEELWRDLGVFGCRKDAQGPLWLCTTPHRGRSQVRVGLFSRGTSGRTGG